VTAVARDFRFTADLLITGDPERARASIEAADKRLRRGTTANRGRITARLDPDRPGLLIVTMKLQAETWREASETGQRALEGVIRGAGIELVSGDDGQPSTLGSTSGDTAERFGTELVTA